MGLRRSVLLKALMSDIERKVYRGGAGPDGKDEEEEEDDIPELQVKAVTYV